MFVDETANILYWMSQDKSLVPSNSFESLTMREREKILNLIENEGFNYYTTSYLFPGYCSMTGYNLRGNGMETVFTRYQEHVKDVQQEKAGPRKRKGHKNAKPHIRHDP